MSNRARFGPRCYFDCFYPDSRNFVSVLTIWYVILCYCVPKRICKSIARTGEHFIVITPTSPFSVTPPEGVRQHPPRRATRPGYQQGVPLIGVNFRPPQATRKGWPYYIRDSTGGTTAASLVGPPLAGGLPGARTGLSERLWGYPYYIRCASV